MMDKKTNYQSQSTNYPYSLSFLRNKNNADEITLFGYMQMSIQA
jgi:hypothetical protein